ncbi:tRNA lysidine(34) synthetase TilS [Akkermansiaceae bacterium]|nr:tRNA lysidine(34) synthetase TilS [Akkermansiaceae bacterium]
MAAPSDLRKEMKRDNLLNHKQPYLLGISGGRDSVFLLHWLRERDFQNVTLCHLNHGLRGEEAMRDEKFVRELAEELGLKVIIGREDVGALAEKESLSLETAAREARHRFFERCAKETGTQEILLAHHADDQVETVLFRLLRGSTGLKGMRARQKIGGLVFLRPLLKTRREEISTYLSERDLPFCEDSTNADSFATRNRIRNEALPLLKEIMKLDPSPALLRATAHQEELEEFLAAELSRHELLDPQGRIHLPTLRQLAPVLRRQALHDYLKEADVPDLSAALIESGLGLLEPDSAASVNLPGGLRLRRKESRLFISA